jgi:translation elongation factor EF-G
VLRRPTGFATSLRSLTQGEGSFSMAFAHYQHVGDALQQKMCDRTVW